MTASKHLPFIFVSIFILPVVLFGYQAVVDPVYSNPQKVDIVDITDPGMLNKDPVIKLLGKSFDEIKQVLGEPDEQGYSGWLGPHYYILFRHKEGFVRFCSPEPENKIAVSIILGQDQEVLGVKVGMHFLEIQNILGSPNFGPELSGDNLYYMDYFLGETKNQTPEIFLSFTADAVNSPTYEAFVKWESFGYGEELNSIYKTGSP